MAKRIFDIIFSIIGLTVLALPLAVISLIILVTNFGPVFYKQTRIGRDGKPFKMWKFRTMVVNADRMGPHITVGDDRRITGIGRILRKTKLDELPQLFNVLFGDMSFVGPRPEVLKYVEMYTPEQRKVLSVRPGITDLPAIGKYTHEAEVLSDAGEDWEKVYIEQVMQDKLRLNLQYVENQSMWLDVKTIMKTLFKLVM